MIPFPAVIGTTATEDASIRGAILFSFMPPGMAGHPQKRPPRFFKDLQVVGLEPGRDMTDIVGFQSGHGSLLEAQHPAFIAMEESCRFCIGWPWAYQGLGKK